VLYRTTALIYAEYTGRDTVVTLPDSAEEDTEVKKNVTDESPSTAGNENK